MRKETTHVIVGILIILSLLILSCQPSIPSTTPPSKQAPPTTTTPTPSADPIKIGHIRSLTGYMAMASKRMVEGFQMAIDEAGGQVAGRKIEVIVEDDNDKPDIAVDKARKLVEQDKVAMIIGPTGAGPEMTVGAYMEKMGVPNLHTNPSPAKIIIDKRQWVFQCGGAEPQLPSTMGRYVYEQLKLRKVNVMTSDFTAGHGFLNAFINVFKKLGGEIVQEQYPPLNNADYGSYLTALKDAEAVVAWFNGADAVKFLSQYEEFGTMEKDASNRRVSWFFFNGQIVNQLPPQAAASVAGKLAPTPYSAMIDTDYNKAFLERFKKRFDYLPEDTSTGPYQGALIALAALKATNGDTNPEKLKQAILDLKIVGPEGPIRFDKEKLSEIKTIYIGKMEKQGKEYLLVPVFSYPDVPPLGF